MTLFDPWLWLALAGVLGALEMLIPGYALLGFGAGAAAVGLVLFGPAEAIARLPYAPVLLLVAWTGVSLAVWLVLTRLYGRRARRRADGRGVNDFENSP